MNVFEQLEHAFQIPWVGFSASLSALIILFAGLRVHSAIAATGGVLPEEGFSIRNVLEVVARISDESPAIASSSSSISPR